ncbi:PilN family type IVB pilus formation outer membrane protein [Burkholderia sp. BCC0044]|uniref:PilN family type IVB pilus formation outer membrane protein n=1 Tax=Burkholderia sp. BCC0044 TaxID=2676295 RepID=UPI00158CBAD6|nr:PilN family type IVB pilus formation outer membrane protein [Burkholderia sp. BCC0044]
MSTLCKLTRLSLAASIIVVLSGCATSTLRDAERTTDRDMAEADASIATLHAAEASAVRVHESGYWVANQSQPLSIKPEMISCNLTMHEAVPLTLSMFADKLQRICGVPVRVSADALRPPSASVSASDVAKGDAGDKNGSRAIVIGPNGPSGDKAPEPKEPTVMPNWQGDLPGLLDSVVAQVGVHWRIKGGEVHIFRTETRTFQIYALPGTDALSSSVTTSNMSSMGISGGGGTGGGGGGGDGGVSGQAGSAQSVATTLTSSVMNDVAKTVQAMVTPGQGKFTLAPGTGSMTITDTPDVLDRIASFIETQNKLLTKQVVLNVKILSVTFDRTDQYGVDWNLAYNGALFGSGITSADAGAVEGAGANVKILKGPFKDSSLLIKALSAQGKVSVVTQPSVTTLNLQAVPMQVSTQTGYVASVTSNQVAQAGTSMGIQPGTVTTGFNMMLLPYAMADRQVLLQYNISLSNLAKLETFGDKKTGQVQLPTVDLRAFAQKVRLRSGETLALSGFEQNSDTSKRSGVGSPNNQLLGGNRYAEKHHSVIVILITPVVAG